MIVKMIASLNEAAKSPTRQEGEGEGEEEEEEGNKKRQKLGDSPSNMSSWSLRLKDPRIVRVSRAFGGKDRHSKVCTVRGLRDRRVRLSVATAIQLYDLQDRLNLNQPSKVIDWLLNAAKKEIDDLPPLPITPGCFSFNNQIMLATSQSQVQPTNNNKPATGSSSRSDFFNPDEAWQKNNSLIPFGAPTYHLDHQTFGFPTESQPTHQQENSLHNFNFMNLPSTLPLSSPSSTHHHIIDPATISHEHLQMLRSASQTNNNNNVPSFFSGHQSPRPFQLNMIRHVNAAQSNTTPDKGQLH